MTDLVELEKDADKIRREIAKEKGRHEETIQGYQSRLKAVLESLEAVSSGLDLAQIDLAETVLAVRGAVDSVRLNDTRSNRSCRSNAVREAVNWFTHLDDPDSVEALRVKNMHKYYLGVKNYDGFGDQGSDCEYGYGPRHGSIVFSIGLRRDRIGSEISYDERNACIYYLRNLSKVQAAKNAAAKGVMA